MIVTDDGTRLTLDSRPWLIAKVLALALGLALGVGACNGQSDAGTGSAASATSTGAGGATTCPAGSHLAGTSCAATLTGWTAVSPLVTARDHHATFAVETLAGTYLYVAAGTNGTQALATVERAKIAADGTLAPFEAAGKLPSGRIGPGVASAGRTVVLAGGLGSNGNSTTTVYVVTIGDDGMPAFATGPALGKDRYHLTLTAAGGYLYAIGGLTQTVMGTVSQSVVDTVERATFDGKTVGAFQTVDPLPWPLTHQAAAVHGQWLYLIGGISKATTRSDVVRAEIGADGKLGAWDKVGDLPEGRGTSAATVFLDQLYVIAGAAAPQGQERDTVLRADFRADGTVGAFTALPALPKARAHSHQAPRVGAFLYSAGGELADVMQGDVFAGALK